MDRTPENPIMTSRIRRGLALLLLAALPLTSLSYTALAQAPGRHPHYVHALSDLRAARWLLTHRPGNHDVARDEEVAVIEIDKAFGEITRAAITDGKDVHAPVALDVPAERGGRLRRALEVLRTVRADVAREEDDPFTRGLRNRAVLHVEEAIHATERALADRHFIH